MAQWDEPGCKLPADRGLLGRLAFVDSSELEDLETVLQLTRADGSRHFEEKDGRIWNRKLLGMFERESQRSEKARKSAAKRWHPDAPDAGEHANASPGHAPEDANACPNASILDAPHSLIPSDSHTLIPSEDPDSSEPSADDSEPASPVVFTIDCLPGKGATKRGSTYRYPVTRAVIEEYGEDYPGVDVETELRKFRSWARSNKAKRKTYGGMPRAMNAWIARQQDRGSTAGGGPTVPRWRLEKELREIEDASKALGPFPKDDPRIARHAELCERLGL